MKASSLRFGSGTRLHPVTQAVSKQLLPVYDKPMIYYHSRLSCSAYPRVLIISTPSIHTFRTPPRRRTAVGHQASYIVQPSPDGSRRPFLGKEFLAGEGCCLALGDNIFYGHDFAASSLAQPAARTSGSYGLRLPVTIRTATESLEFDANRRAISLEEKPTNPNRAMPLPVSTSTTTRSSPSPRPSSPLPVENLRSPTSIAGTSNQSAQRELMDAASLARHGTTTRL